MIRLIVCFLFLSGFAKSQTPEAQWRVRDNATWDTIYIRNDTAFRKVNSEYVFLKRIDYTRIVQSSGGITSGDVTTALGYTPVNPTAISNINNTSDANKPVSTATSTALGLKQNTITSGTTLQYIKGDFSLGTFPTTTSFLSNSTDKNLISDAKLTVVNNTTGTNTGDNSANSTYASDYRAANFVAGTNYLAPSGSVAAVTGTLPFASGGGASAATSASSGTMTVNMTTRIITITPTNACTFNASGGTTGQITTFVITTSGASPFTLTWGTNYRTVGTLSTGSVTAKIFCVTFLCTNGTQWVEISRTAVIN